MINGQENIQNNFSYVGSPIENELSFNMILKNELNFFKNEKFWFDINEESPIIFNIGIYLKYEKMKSLFLKIFNVYEKLACLSHLKYEFTIRPQWDDGVVGLIIYHPENVDEFNFIKFLKENRENSDDLEKI